MTGTWKRLEKNLQLSGNRIILKKEQELLLITDYIKGFASLHRCLKNNGVKKGDRVCIYMGMVPELAYAVLGCARIGAIHSVIFGGFSAQSIADRLEDAQAEFIITCDGAYRGGKDIPLKSVIDDALIGNKTVKKVIVYTRTRTPVSMIKGRDVWWEDEMEYAEHK